MMSMGAPPSSVESLAAQADQLRAQGDLEASIEVLRRAYAIEPLPVLLNNIARALEALGRYREAAATYHKVADDPQATDPQLVALDLSRLKALEPKLSRAWVQVESSVAAEQLLVDGARALLRDLGHDRRELELAPGAHVFEYSTDGTDVVLRFGSFAADTSTIGFAIANDATLPLTNVHARAVTIDGYRVRASMAGVERVHVAAGAHRIELSIEGGATFARAVIARSGEELDPRPPAPSVAVAVAGSVRAPVVAPEPSSPPWLAIALGCGGAGLGAAGAIFTVLASGNRQDVKDALAQPAEARALTMREALELESSANREATTGAVLLSAGVAVAAGALVAWMLHDGTSGTMAAE